MERSGSPDSNRYDEGGILVCCRYIQSRVGRDAGPGVERTAGLEPASTGVAHPCVASTHPRCRRRGSRTLMARLMRPACSSSYLREQTLRNTPSKNCDRWSHPSESNRDLPRFGRTRYLCARMGRETGCSRGTPRPPLCGCQRPRFETSSSGPRTRTRISRVKAARRAVGPVRIAGTPLPSGRDGPLGEARHSSPAGLPVGARGAARAGGLASEKRKSHRGVPWWLHDARADDQRVRRWSPPSGFAARRRPDRIRA
jgi:hypothetical protein